MMWPILTKGQSDDPVYVTQADLIVQYEKLPAMFQTVTLWRQIILSVVLNWIIGPFVSVTASLVSLLLTEDHASGCMGYVTGSSNISRRSHHGRTRQVRYSYQTSSVC
jgi:hypothetical protein